MKPKSFIFNIAVWICIFHFSSNQLSGQLNSKWEMLETDNFIVYYPNGYELEANQALQNLEYYRNGVIKLTGNKIDKIPIIIEDYGMYSNAYADAWKNKIHIFRFGRNKGELIQGIELMIRPRVLLFDLSLGEPDPST